MEKDTIEKIKKYAFFELSENDKEEMKELFTTEEEYNQIKGFIVQMEAISFESFQPSSQVKKDLDAVFTEVYPASKGNSFLALIVPKNKPIFRQPLVQLAAIALLLLLILPMFDSPLVEDTIQVAEVKKENQKEMRKEKIVTKEKENFPETKVETSKQPILEKEKVKEPTDYHLTDTRNLKLEVQQEENEDAEEMIATMYNHPDGIYQGEAFVKNEESSLLLSQSIAETSELLDILSVTF